MLFRSMQRIDVLEDVRRFVGDEEDVEIFERLVDITDFGGFDGGVLAVGGDEFRERGEEGFDPGSRHRVELTRKDGWMERLSVVAKKKVRIAPLPPLVHIEAANTTCASS